MKNWWATGLHIHIQSLKVIATKLPLLASEHCEYDFQPGAWLGGHPSMNQPKQQKQESEIVVRPSRAKLEHQTTGQTLYLL